ncbi:ninjurin-2 isoform X1 [Nilaparvata lugens]|uniref:ninjurin-2 isoform X1 n=1 Tax=Nilaparvata lugens TaxID=108931 RepID=UPI00193E7036|nr:ninjurin-2 isoform X1 [Nilaparvata lugens]
MVSRLRRILGNMSSISPEEKPLDANRYATKKTIAQGMLDIALLTANASQLKYILQVGHKHEFYTLMLGLITTSIILQIGVGILFLIIGGLDLNKQNDRQPAVILNDIILIMVFLITTLNVVISGFGIQHTSTGPFTYRFNVTRGLMSSSWHRLLDIVAYQYQSAGKQDESCMVAPYSRLLHHARRHRRRHQDDVQRRFKLHA